MIDPVELTRRLIAMDTAGSGEERAARFLGGLLEAAGARVAYDAFAPGRASLVAYAGNPSVRPLALSGHLDTVPADPASWSSDPFGPVVTNGRIVGRGASDMKSGVAVLVSALVRHLAHGAGVPAVVLVLSAAEETGCEGVQHLVDHVALPCGGPLLVAEPTGNRVATGHKGALWVRAGASGVSAHGSRPDLGVSAITPLAAFALALAEAGVPGSHPAMGRATTNVGTFQGGVRTNLVPDAAEMTVDVRLVPGVSSAETLTYLTRLAGPRVCIETILDRAPVYSRPDAPLATLAQTIAGGEPCPPLSYFTDASVLAEALGASETVFLGPGDPEAAHTTDESVAVASITRGAELYAAILERWS
ncbi:MAG: M20 family metallopeptidase [Actinomycetia bacterium]|nr:M20 family metallopeptidase [Actinomycetes bacterium]